MASEEQLKLSNLIKSVHSNLREKSKKIGVSEAWKEHCKNNNLLKEYSVAMKTLATNYWQSNFTKKCNAYSRIVWIYYYSLNYFIGNEAEREILRQRQREVEIAEKIDVSIDQDLPLPQLPLKLLDVGSCFNPFSIYEIFEVLAIDIAPASPSVEKLDFLEEEEESNDLPHSSFDIVVFSLFLEYIPCPDLRFKCCEKALTLLKPEGLLFIITPDSKHVGANAQLMKSWRFMLAEIGFSRIKYEKLPHIHCLAFRKSLHPKITERWAVLHKNCQVYKKMFIPQDLLDHKADEKNCSD
ncbi:S-adenosylmethionine sensor upstream of mTORC1 isoform X2 [Harmonia axyridis]|nr:S-adenosylmethionine sensor upstream of mTORC1 isoform X2 [Harmonia axyridis]